MRSRGLEGNGELGGYVQVVRKLAAAAASQVDRDIIVQSLSLFRSKKVEVNVGFEFLGAVLWSILDQCEVQNDIRSAKTVMMLSQTFYRVISNTKASTRSHLSGTGTGSSYFSTGNSTSSSSSSSGIGIINANSASKDRNSLLDKRSMLDSHYDVRGSSSGGSETVRNSEQDDGQSQPQVRRQYAKDCLMTHGIWRHEGFWEQALWQMVLEQLQTIQVGGSGQWYQYSVTSIDLEDLVRRVHDVTFSQLMAVAHSMVELNCPSDLTKALVVRMCMVYQLPEGQRHALLHHLNEHRDLGA